MGKKKQHHRKRLEEELPSSAFDCHSALEGDADGADDGNGAAAVQGDEECDEGLKHDLYQRAVQAPRGEISYLQKFFLTYVGGRIPLHMREDFCGTALICAEWVRGDARRTAVGVDLDDDALSWGLKNNVLGGRGDTANRVDLFHQNVLHPLAKSGKFVLENRSPASVETRNGGEGDEDPEETRVEQRSDVICALNFSCCCLQERKDLVSYFRQALSSISNKGGVFVMDLYGGLSSEQSLRIRRRYSDFTYTWEQEEFDIIKRTTRISLHFQLAKSRRVLRHAFSYHWRLWTIPEVRDCLDEAGFDSTHLWLCERPELLERKNGLDNTNDDKGDYEELESFNQCDAWNAYIVGVKNRRSQTL
ncbi:uncharacterized protein LOC9638833 [Selaginella moellendorffii]|uniref:uncharacterized protein LOC9647039 n=1 Tax=Selaginella moellendorffii TaxID=88036 RepID=UPI000D1C8F23|nr:uncharacterized protein LOC9647039 [Selaginella moellendorffii]XP_002993827.2 uncharacterized protein LOC9638833 [Selaginella moellendorffii]|eukprot:XP_002980045.2 uncharacterized protein LOC9647039 [Selaginella moellendorffii]